MKYVVGFLFSKDLDQVILVRKNRPEWQDGLLNGVGGKVESHEDFLEAMKREFEEEAGVFIDSWSKYCTYQFESGYINFYATRDDEAFNQSETKTDEEILRKRVSDVKKLKTVPNLNWLIPMALNHIKNQGVRKFFVEEDQ